MILLKANTCEYSNALSGMNIYRCQSLKYLPQRQESTSGALAPVNFCLASDLSFLNVDFMMQGSLEFLKCKTLGN